MLFIADPALSQLNCDYYDTVDLTGIQPFKNGSYLYENIIIPADLIAEYDYRLTGENDESTYVPKYFRGCACRLKPCVRFCCHHNLMFMNGECIGDTDKALEYDPYLNITTSDGSVVEKHVLNEFVVQRHLPLPCSEIGTYHLDDRIAGYRWSLFENGSFKRTEDGLTFDKSEYCLQPVELPDREIRLVPHNCQIPSQDNIYPKILVPISLISFLITIAVYLYLPKLRNLHGKCFVCYLISLFIGYSLLFVDLFKACIYYYYLCYITGYLGYFGMLAAFFWLTVISLDLWNSFRGTNYNVNRLTSGNRFRIYNLYAWGMPLVLTILIAILDQVLLDPNLEDLTWVPGVYYNGCWIKTFDWSAMVYFYGPMLILIVFNTTLFILVAIQIFKVKKELNNMVQRQERKQKLNSDKQNYSFFLRLFIIMGVSWSLEIVSYLVSNDRLWNGILKSADFLHYSEGLIILIFFVLKRNIYEACLARLRQQMEKIYRLPIMFQFVSSLITVAMTVFQTIVGDASNSSLLMYFLLSGVICQLFLYCWFGNEVYEQSKTLSTSAFGCDWFKLDMKLKRSLLIFMINADRPFLFTAGGFMGLTLTSFANILDLNIWLGQLAGLPLIGVNQEAKCQRIGQQILGFLMLIALFCYVSLEIYDLKRSWTNLDMMTQNLVMTLTHLGYWFKVYV
ncbi:uncharacterized protein Dwil_GK20993 [Drosophila willistoni]|uniref:G-protein coupled receptors family 2 profile 2 domain-containing protein n=1 Tax=Drosophila willistoni TaxID=7260 RepID=B4MXA9_DROWI|nr:uncharacterized protein Dwil_GK20993 [Drosophila willistoni]